MSELQAKRARSERGGGDPRPAGRRDRARGQVARRAARDDHHGSRQTTRARVDAAEDELATGERCCARRLIDIYKRGPLHHDRGAAGGAVVRRARGALQIPARAGAARPVARDARARTCYDQIAGSGSSSSGCQRRVRAQPRGKAREEERLRASRSRGTTNLQRGQALGETDPQARLAAIATRRVAARERHRLVRGSATQRGRAAERAAALSSSTLKTSDFGKLDWPVDGTIIYRFGRAVNPNNTTIRWNGIGIAAASGTPVKAVADGRGDGGGADRHVRPDGDRAARRRRLLGVRLAQRARRAARASR